MAALGLGRLESPLKRTITLRSTDYQSRLSFRVGRRGIISLGPAAIQRRSLVLHRSSLRHIGMLLLSYSPMTSARAR